MSDIKSQISVLYAEDERSVRMWFSKLLTSHGYHVRAVRNGSDALKDFQSRRSDVVILDVMMPVLSGRDTCAAIREVDPDVPILFHTALDSELDELVGLNVGADDYVSKMSSDEIFLAHVAAAARRARKAPSAGFLFGSGRVDTDACIFSCGDVSSRLSLREVELLRILCESPRQIFSKDFLQTRLFGVGYRGNLRSFDKTLERLKSKLGPSAACIVTIPRQGIEYATPN